MELRHGAPGLRNHETTGRLISPVPTIISELERAYLHFNDRFFGGALSRDVVIAIERPANSYRGYYCSGQWTDGEKRLGHIAICGTALTGSPVAALEVLLHEMVHCRNDQCGFRDTNPRTQYHNRLFRDVAQLVGLRCGERHPYLGYARTTLDERGLKAIETLSPDEKAFVWKSGPGNRMG